MSETKEDRSGSAPLGSFAGRFERLSEVATGGISRVEAAHDPTLGRLVAIKVLRPDKDSGGPIERMFAQEARITGQLEHPNVAPIYDLGQSETGPFIVMKLIRGKTLGELLNELRASPANPEDLQQFVQIVLRLCHALSFAHSRGVIHCDVKPDNVMVGDYGQLYLMDWGVAFLLSQRKARDPSAPVEPLRPEVIRSLRDSLVRLTPSHDMTSSVRGTPAYMAPEQILGQVDGLSERTDVFGLGGILHEILTGVPPNDWEHWRGPGLVDKAISIPAEGQLWPQLPPELCRITQKALSYRAEDRYPTVEALRADLDQFLRRGGWFATRVVPAGETIVAEGGAGDAAYIIEDGECDVYKDIQGERVHLRRLGRGEAFGETAILTAAPRTATVVAVTDVTLKVITAESLNRELDRNPWLAGFVRSLAGLFRERDAELWGRSEGG